MTTQPFDFVVAGGGIAGVLTAVKLCISKPSSKVILLEKEPHLGGRLVTGGTSDSFGYGMNAISVKLYDYWNHILKNDPESNDLPSFSSQRLEKCSILMGNKLTPLSTSDLCNEKGARALGGLAAQRQWGEIDAILTSGEESGTFADKWKLPRKSPGPLVLETYSQAFGITNIWDSSVAAISERGKCLTERPFSGNWDTALKATVERFVSSGQLTIELNARIIDADFTKGQGWNIDSAKGVVQASSLIVAQPPWIASQWLPKTYWPAPLAALNSKTKPVSTVVLSAPIISGFDDSVPQLIFIPSENSHAIVNNREIVLKANIDYEMSLVAPDVVKSVKKLKRGLKKLTASLPQLVVGIDHVALVPVSWAQTPLSSERRHIEKIKLNSVQDSQLSFCGDAYGNSYDGDLNIIDSINAACEALLP